MEPRQESFAVTILITAECSVTNPKEAGGSPASLEDD